MEKTVYSILYIIHAVLKNYVILFSCFRYSFYFYLDVTYAWYNEFSGFEVKNNMIYLWLLDYMASGFNSPPLPVDIFLES